MRTANLTNTNYTKCDTILHQHIGIVILIFAYKPPPNYKNLRTPTTISKHSDLTNS